MSAPKHAHDAVIGNRHIALSGEVAGYDIVSDLFDLLNDGEPEGAAFAVIEDVTHVFGPRAANVSLDLHQRVAQNALSLAWRMLRVIDMMDAARSAADAEFLKTKDLVTPADLEAKLDESFRAGAQAMRLQFVEAAEKAAESQRAAAPKSRRLKLVSKAPASKRAPASSKAVRRAS